MRETTPPRSLDGLAADWPALSALLDEALTLAPEQREPWLAGLSGERARHRETLQALLAARGAAETDDFLAELPRLPGRAAVDGVVDDVQPGGLVGPYRLIEEIGVGGMGRVWLAERADGTVQRKVALKLPHVAWGNALAARLAREREILASLAHPNIARLYDAGLDAQGRPYLALEHVDGTPIDRWCAEHRAPVRQRLALLLQVAAALAHAHTRLVIHRDLKPSNILVTREGEVRLLDFGIAKLLHEDGEPVDASELTRVSGRLLTPDYASPEQLRGERVGTASDVYSLGVVAYELLAGARPYRLKADADLGLGQAIGRVVVAPASSAAPDPARRRELAGDLDAILHVALKLEPAERYPTVDAFAADIQRHLDEVPVQARPDRLAYRLRKFVARNTLQVSAAALVAVAVLGGAGLALWQAREARQEAARAEQVKDFALSILEASDAESGAGATTTVADVLQKAQARIERERFDRPEVAVELMSALAYALLGHGRTDEAEAIARKAVERARAALGADHRFALAATVVHGEALRDQGKFADAVAVLTPAVAQARRQGDTHQLVTALQLIATAKGSLADGAGSIAFAQAAVDAIAASKTPVRKLDEVYALAVLANTLVVGGRPGGAEVAARAVAAARAVYGDKLSESVIQTRVMLSRGLMQEGRLGEAAAELSTLRTDAAALLGPGHPTLAEISQQLGATRFESGDVAGAIEAFTSTLAIQEATGAPVARRALTRHELARALVAGRRDEEALVHLSAATALVPLGGPSYQAFAARARVARADVLARLGRVDEADPAFAEVDGLAKSPVDQATFHARLAALRSRQQRHDEAVALARQGVADLAGEPAGGAQAMAAGTLGTVLLAAGRPAEAVAPLDEARRLYETRQVAVSPDRADVVAALARARAAAVTAK